MYVFVYDTFTNADSTALTSHTGEKGAGYTIHPSGTNAPVITSNRARTTNATSWVYASGVPPSSEYIVETLVRQVTDEVANAGIQARLSTSADTYYIARYDMNVNEWQLRKVIAGGATSLGTWAETLSNGDERVCRLECFDGAKKLFVDGIERISSADNEITDTGRVGIRMTSLASGDTTGLHFDYLKAWVPTIGAVNVRNDLRPAIFKPGHAR